MKIEPLLTTGEVARIFRVDTRTVCRWADRELLASTRTPGGQRRFSEAEVQSLLKSLTKERIAS